MVPKRHFFFCDGRHAACHQTWGTILLGRKIQEGLFMDVLIVVLIVLILLAVTGHLKL